MSQTITLTDIIPGTNVNTITTSNDISQGHNSRSIVTGVEVTAFSECFLTFIIIIMKVFFFLLLSLLSFVYLRSTLSTDYIQSAFRQYTGFRILFAIFKVILKSLIISFIIQ